MSVEQKKETVQLMHALRGFNKKISSELDYKHASELLLRESVNLLKSDYALLLWVRENDHQLHFEKSLGFSRSFKNRIIDKKDTLNKFLKYRSSVLFISKNENLYHLVKQSAFLTEMTGFTAFQLAIRLHVNNVPLGLLLLSGPLTELIAHPKVRQLLAELAERAGITLRQARLLYSLKRESLEKDLLLETGRKITSSVNLDELLDLILDQLQQVVHYDKGSIFILDPRSKSIARVARRGPMPLFDQVDFMRKTEGLCNWVMAHAEPVVVDDVSTDKRYYPIYLDTQSEMDVPIVNRGVVLGVFNLESNRKSAFSRRDRRLVQALAGQAAVAIDNAWLFEQLKEKQEMERELRIAKRFQRALLPRRIPQNGQYSFAALNIPSRTVGGDLYDFIEFSSTRTGITIGDVSGKGTPGAILMATLYSTYRGLVRLRLPINQMMHDLNNTLKSRISSSSFITFFYGELDHETGNLSYCNAGHCAPILIRADGSVDVLHSGGTVLGFIENYHYEMATVKIKEGDCIFFYTDGLTEAMNDRNELFGEERLLQFLKAHLHLSPAALLRKVYRVIRQFTGVSRPQDDFTAVFLRANPPEK